MTVERLGRIYALVLLTVFVGLISVVPVVTMMGRTDALRFEKRAPAKAPALPKTLAEWETWPTRFEAFFDDSFGLREPLIRLNSWVSTTLLGRSASNRVLEGHDGWLFYTGDYSLEIHRGERRLGDGALATWRSELQRRRDWAAAHGVAYVFAVAPDKAEIYPELMPRRVARSRHTSLIDQMVAMTRQAGLPLVDLRPDLSAAKASGHQIYYQHDSHWNDYGASVAARTLTRAIAEGVPGTMVGARPGSVVGLDETVPPETRVLAGGDLATMGRLEVSEIEPVARLVSAGCTASLGQLVTEPIAGEGVRMRRAQCPGGAGRLLVLHDSFGEALERPLASVFGEATFLWAYASFAQFQTAVLAAKPDVVIELRVARKLLDTPDAAAPGIE